MYNSTGFLLEERFRCEVLAFITVNERLVTSPQIATKAPKEGKTAVIKDAFYECL